jgi:hypothetical protein
MAVVGVSCGLVRLGDFVPRTSTSGVEVPENEFHNTQTHCPRSDGDGGQTDGTCVKVAWCE